MNNREAHFYLEELQRMMTQHRGIFSEEFVCANGMAIQALERIQSVDAVPVVRCKDCKYLFRVKNGIFVTYGCERDWCCYAERE